LLQGGVKVVPHDDGVRNRGSLPDS
jgi:hypothetical protein